MIQDIYKANVYIQTFLATISTVAIKCWRRNLFNQIQSNFIIGDFVSKMSKWQQNAEGKIFLHKIESEFINPRYSIKNIKSGNTTKFWRRNLFFQIENEFTNRRFSSKNIKSGPKMLASKSLYIK